MLVSIMAYPEFYKKHMEVYIALAPGFTLTHHKIGIFSKLGESE